MGSVPPDEPSTSGWQAPADSGGHAPAGGREFLQAQVVEDPLADRSRLPTPAAWPSGIPPAPPEPRRQQLAYGAEGSAAEPSVVIVEPELAGQAHVGPTPERPEWDAKRALEEPLPARYGAPWSDADTALIPRSQLERPGLLTDINHAISSFMAALGLSSRQAGETTRRMATIVAALAAGFVVFFALFADQWVVQRAEQRARHAEQAAQRDAAFAAASGQTLVVSIPSGADVVADGLLVGRTPISLARGDQEALLLVRLPGYEPQMVRVGPSGPAEVKVVLNSIAVPGARAPGFGVQPR